MPQIRIEDSGGRASWFDITDVVKDREGRVMLFSITVGRDTDHAHFVTAGQNLRQEAHDLNDARKKFKAARNLLQAIEKEAAEMEWFADDEFRSMREHVSKCGGLVVGGDLLWKFWKKHRSFPHKGYYNAKGEFMLPGPFRPGSRDYRD
jgi:hypothetical protein